MNPILLKDGIARSKAREFILANPTRYHYVVVQLISDKHLWEEWMKGHGIKGSAITVQRAHSGWSDNEPNRAICTTFGVRGDGMVAQLEGRLRNIDAMRMVQRHKVERPVGTNPAHLQAQWLFITCLVVSAIGIAITSLTDLTSVTALVCLLFTIFIPAVPYLVMRFKVKSAVKSHKKAVQDFNAGQSAK